MGSQKIYAKKSTVGYESYCMAWSNHVIIIGPTIHALKMPNIQYDISCNNYPKSHKFMYMTVNSVINFLI